jgi:hypothetical protein
MVAVDTQDLNTKQADYKAAVNAWVEAIQHEEELGMQDHSVIEVDAWEQAGFKEEALRNEAKAAKKRYEQALRSEFYGFEG